MLLKLRKQIEGLEQVSNKMKDKRVLRAELWFCLFLIMLLGVFFLAASGCNPVSIRAPLIVMIPLGAMLLGQLLIAVKNLRQASDSQSEKEGQQKDNSQATRRAVQIILWLVLLLGMIYLGGHLAGIAVFLFLFLRFVCKDPWRTAIYVGAGTAAGLYLLFERVLMIPLYQGVVYLTFSNWLWA